MIGNLEGVNLSSQFRCGILLVGCQLQLIKLTLQIFQTQSPSILLTL
jgi:hypothetical protein